MRYAGMTTTETVALALAWCVAIVVMLVASAGTALVGATIAGVVLRLMGVVG